ncbi:uncharacterized protein [Amphiura filiformis]|uniref:uncharacterized protein n=1 Tax=Amphiura filiformis TaxID=82378 RepID=UPI003B21311E
MVSQKISMDFSDSNDNLTPSTVRYRRLGGGNNGNLLIFLVVTALLVAVVALIIACVGVAGKKGGVTNINVSSNPQSGNVETSTDSSADSRIWTFAIGDGQYREAYIDATSGELKGFLVDFVHAVCNTANKNCRIMGDLWTRCWDTYPGEPARGGVGLTGRWYDACVGWVGTYDRHRTFQFTDPYGKAETETFFVKKGVGATFNWRDLTGKKVGILDGYSSDEHCLVRQTGIASAPLDASQIRHFLSPSDLVAAVNSDTVDVAFALNNVISADQLDQIETEIKCYNSGPGLMLRVDSDLTTWWNKAQENLMASSEYNRVCQDLTEEHGHQPGRDPSEFCFLN